jgi:ribosomal protein S18 acetylase RimI-like enzyme
MQDLCTRPATPQDERFLQEMLYLALFVPPGEPPFPRSILETDVLRRYVDGFGAPGTADRGVIAETTDGEPIGAAWVRVLPERTGYGYVGDGIPELSIAVVEGHRGRGVGSALLTELLSSIDRSFAAVSLSVDAANPALALYERFGFTRVGAGDDPSIVMVKALTGRPPRSSRAAPS